MFWTLWIKGHHCLINNILSVFPEIETDTHLKDPKNMLLIAVKNKEPTAIKARYIQTQASSKSVIQTLALNITLERLGKILLSKQKVVA